MICNRANPQVADKILRESHSTPLVSQVADAVEGSLDPFEVQVEGQGLEVRVCAYLPNGLPNRARMKIFSPKPGHTLVFFYKKSVVPYSRDRYSYGGVDVRARQAEAQEIAEWLAFLTSGFHPEKRPAKLQRAFPYEIPE